MSDTKKPTLSEIRARHELVTHHYDFNARSELICDDIPHLLDLVNRMGKALEGLSEMHITFCDRCVLQILADGTIEHESNCPVPEARALLEELKQ